MIEMPSMVCVPLSVMSAVVAAMQLAFASRPCATVSTYNLLAMSVDAVGVVVIVPAVAVRFAIVPSEVSEDAVTPDANVAPVSVLAGAITTAVVIEVVRPFALIVTTGIAVLPPDVPALATEASVDAAVTFPLPSKLGEV